MNSLDFSWREWAKRTKDLPGGQETPQSKRIVLDKWDTLISISGPGSFISAQICKTAGNDLLTDLTTIALKVDDRVDKYLVIQSFERARVTGLACANPYGITYKEDVALIDGNDVVIKTLTIGFPVPLNFNEKLLLQLRVADNNVQGVMAKVILASADGGLIEGDLGPVNGGVGGPVENGGGGSEPDYP